MKNFKISITRKGNLGISRAPALFVQAEDHNKAAELAREKSGLGRFESWSFFPIEIK